MTRYRRILAGEIAAIIAGTGNFNPDAGTFAADPADEPYIDETRQQRRARERSERKKDKKDIKRWRQNL